MKARRHRRILPTVGGPDFDPPAIDALPESADRPRFSVMIPTFNCAEYLRVCLASVLEQDPGPGRMQIEVIDDCSTLDDPESVVRELAGDRVSFRRQPQNVGAVGNFNTCIERSAGELVHILHGDDVVLPGFYAAIDQLALDVPDAGFYATRVHAIDEGGCRSWMSESLAAYTRAASTDLRAFACGTPIQFVGTVVRRAAYEAVGGFRPGLAHVADWDMWMRLVVSTGLACIDEPLAEYRQFAASDTSRLKRTATNLLDIDRFASLMSTAEIDFDVDSALAKARLSARLQEHCFQRLGDHEAARANHRYWAARATTTEYLRWTAGSIRDGLRAKFVPCAGAPDYR